MIAKLISYQGGSALFLETEDFIKPYDLSLNNVFQSSSPYRNLKSLSDEENEKEFEKIYFLFSCIYPFYLAKYGYNLENNANVFVGPYVVKRNKTDVEIEVNYNRKGMMTFAMETSYVKTSQGGGDDPAEDKEDDEATAAAGVSTTVAPVVPPATVENKIATTSVVDDSSPVAKEPEPQFPNESSSSEEEHVPNLPPPSPPLPPRKATPPPSQPAEAPAPAASRAQSLIPQTVPPPPPPRSTGSSSSPTTTKPAPQLSAVIAPNQNDANSTAKEDKDKEEAEKKRKANKDYKEDMKKRFNEVLEEMNEMKNMFGKLRQQKENTVSIGNQLSAIQQQMDELRDGQPLNNGEEEGKKKLYTIFSQTSFDVWKTKRDMVIMVTAFLKADHDTRVRMIQGTFFNNPVSETLKVFLEPEEGKKKKTPPLLLKHFFGYPDKIKSFAVDQYRKVIQKATPQMVGKGPSSAKKIRFSVKNKTKKSFFRKIRKKRGKTRRNKPKRQNKIRKTKKNI